MVSGDGAVVALGDKLKAAVKLGNDTTFEETVCMFLYSSLNAKWTRGVTASLA